MKSHPLAQKIFILGMISASLNAEETGITITGKEPTIQLKNDSAPQKKVCRAKRLRDERKKKRAERKTMSHMAFEELKKEKNAKVAANDKEGAVRYLEKMQVLCNDLTELKSIMLELADFLFELEAYSKAADNYNKFTVLYPGSDEVEYAMYRAIVSNFKLTLDAEHDQSKTMETKELAQKFLERGDLFTKHNKEVEKILADCDEKLLATEENIARFYMKRGSIKSAQHRVDGMKKDFLDKNIPDVTIRIAKLESELGAQQLAIEPPKLASDTLLLAQSEEANSPQEKSAGSPV